METTPISTTSAPNLLGQYEVFLSFCGKDTRKGFTDFLYTYLVGAGIRTFRDDNELRVGEKIGLDLLKSIEESKISIPIFSKNYASSKWCLLELAHMVDCHKCDGMMILPIFYDVVPFDVRHQSGIYEEAFAKHEKDFDGRIIQEWKEALTYVGQLKGYELDKETNGLEGELVKKVVRDVLSQLKKNYMRVPDNLVGMDDHIEEMMGLLQVDSGGIRVVGIHGMGGIGKTTIAKVIYNQLCESFDYCCFLEDVRAKAKQGHNGLVNLQEQLVSKILKPQFVRIVDADDGVNRIKDAVHKKKGFIILDDVDEKYQFDKLVGEYDGFGTGSRIIVTTRNKAILCAIEVTYKKKGLLNTYKSYEPELMDPNHSLQLFSKYAFMRDSPPEDYFILSTEVVSTAAGLPLVLVTLGSLFFGNDDKDLWKEKLRELEKIPHEEVLKKLRIGFEALNDREKHIFLDIACLFIGEDKTNPFYMWDDCEFYPRNGINVLVLRSLVKVGDDNNLRMHDQLRDLGRQIVYEESMNEPGERSRLWRHDEAMDVLERCMGTKNVEALCLDLRPEDTDMVDHGTRCLSGPDFGQLPNLRFLRVGSTDLGGDFKHQLSKLRWLSWSCLGMFTPTNFHLKNLVILDLLRSTITDDWKGWNEIKMAKKLKVLSLSFSKCITRAPNLSPFPILARLNLSHCLGLKKIDPSIGNLTNLRVLDLSNCDSLESVDCSTFRTLERLDLRFCTRLRKLGGLERVEFLDMSHCKSIERFSNLLNFKKIKILILKWCENLIEIQVQGLESLEHLDVHGCKGIKRLGDLSSSKMLKKIDIWGCENLIEIQVLGMEFLEHLNVHGCNGIKRLGDLSSSKMLKKIDISCCKNLVEIQFEGLEYLEHLDMHDCKCIERLGDLSSSKMLNKLDIRGCDKLVEIQGLDRLESLEVLDIRGCNSIEKLPGLSRLHNLREINVTDCEKLREIRGLEELKYLTLLHATGVKRLENLPHLPNTTIWQSYLIAPRKKQVVDTEVEERVTQLKKEAESVERLFEEWLDDRWPGIPPWIDALDQIASQMSVLLQNNSVELE